MQASWHCLVIFIQINPSFENVFHYLLQSVSLSTVQKYYSSERNYFERYTRMIEHLKYTVRAVAQLFVIMFTAAIWILSKWNRPTFTVTLTGKHLCSPHTTGHLPSAYIILSIQQSRSYAYFNIRAYGITVSITQLTSETHITRLTCMVSWKRFCFVVLTPIAVNWMSPDSKAIKQLQCDRLYYTENYCGNRIFKQAAFFIFLFSATITVEWMS